MHHLTSDETQWTDPGALLGVGAEWSLEVLFGKVPAKQRERVRQAVLGASCVETSLTHGLLGRDGRLLTVEHHVALDADERTLVGRIYDVSARDQMEAALELLAKMSSGEDDDEFFRACTRALAQAYGTRFAFIATVEPDGQRAQTRAVWTGEEFGEDFVYDLSGSPCQDVMSLQKELIPEGAAGLYPEDVLLAEMGVESYFGAPLFDSDGRVFGIISLMDTFPLSVSSWMAPLLAVFASRVATELVRRREAAGALERERRLESQLEGSRRLEALGRLAGGVAHDFNNLLTVIGGNVELLTEAPDLGGAEQELLREVAESTRQAGVMTQRLASFSRGELVQPELVDVAAALVEQTAILRRLAGTRISLVMEPSTETLPCLLDAGQLEQILLNLITNARDAMPDGGRVTVAVRPFLERERSLIEILVVDEGCGMSAEVQSQVFEPFFTTKGNRGTGLGLATVYGIVRSAGGRVEVRSARGEGSRFRVLLPLCEPAE